MKQIVKASLISILLTITYLSLKYNDINNVKGRYLTSIQDYNNLCVNTTYANSVIYIHPNSTLSQVTDTLANFISNFSYIKQDQTDNIYNAIINSDATARYHLVTELFAPYIIFIAFGGFTIILWILYIICCFKPCLFCKGLEEEPKVGCRTISYIMLIISILGVIALSIIGFVFASRLPPKLNSTECSIMRMFLDIKSGQNKSAPLWIGANNIGTVFGLLNTNIDLIYNNYNSTKFPDTSYTTADENSYKTILTNSNNNLQNRQTRNPNPFNINTTYIPGFIKAYGPVSSSNTITNSFITEFHNIITNTGSLINQLQSATKILITNKNSTNILLSSFQSIFINLNSALDTFDSNYVNKLRSFQQQTAAPLNNTFIGLFASLLFLAILFILFTSLYVYKDIKWMRIVSHFIWNLITLVTIPIFVIGGLFCLMGTILLYGGPILQAVFSLNGLNVLFPNDPSVANILDICMNKKGNITSYLLGNNTSQSLPLQNFLFYVNQISNASDILQNPKSNSKVLYTQNLVTNISSDLSLEDPSNLNQDSVRNSLINLNTFSNNNNNSSKQVNCSSNTYDIFVTNNDCYSGYTYISSSDPTNNLHYSSCLNLMTWPSNAINTRYSSSPQCSSVNILQIIQSYKSSFTNFSLDLNPIINQTQIDLNNIYSSFSLSSNKMINSISSIQGVINPFVNLLNPIIRYGNLFDMTNCGFLASDAANLIDIFQPMGSSLIQVGACLSALALINWILLFFGLIVLIRKTSSAFKVPLVEDKII